MYVSWNLMTTYPSQTSRAYELHVSDQLHKLHEDVVVHVSIQVLLIVSQSS